MTMVEFFRDKGGRHAMLVLDDLSKHAALTGARERIRDRHTSLSVQISMVRQDGIRQEIADLWAGRHAMQH